MSRLLLGGDESDVAVEMGGISYTDTLGTAVLTVAGFVMTTSLTESLSLASMTMTTAVAGPGQTWVVQG